MKSKMYWLIFLTVSALVTLSLLYMSGTFKNNKFSKGDASEMIMATRNDSENGTVNKKKSEMEQKQDTEDSSVKKDEVDLATSNADFESDPEDFDDSSSDLKDFDKSDDFDKVDSSIY